MENKETKFWLIPIVLIALFFISIFDLPYGFYTFLRIAVCILSLIFVFFCYTYDCRIEFLIPSVLVAILWNPILPVYLDKETWVIFDVIAIVVEGILAIFSYKLWKES